jgi:hypothetical protein
MYVYAYFRSFLRPSESPSVEKPLIATVVLQAVSTVASYMYQGSARQVSGASAQGRGVMQPSENHAVWGLSIALA